jgi:hypothetical protein
MPAGRYTHQSCAQALSRRENYFNGTRSSKRTSSYFGEFSFRVIFTCALHAGFANRSYHFSSYCTHLTSTKKTVPLILGSPFPPPPPPLRPSCPHLRLRLCLCLRPRLRVSLRLPTFALASCTPNRLGTRILHVIRACESILGGNRQ